MGCIDGLTIELKAESWPAGAYGFRVRLDDETITCTGALPLPECGSPALSCDGPGVTITESGCALPPDQHAFGEIVIDAHPDEVEVGLDYAGKTRVGYTSKPIYSTVRPNGPDCEPMCKQGGIAMKVPALPAQSVPIKEPEPEVERVGTTTACLATPPPIPSRLPDPAQACLESLVAARKRFGFLAIPKPESVPCAVDEIDADGVIVDRGRVVHFDDRKREIVFDSTDEYDQRTVVTEARLLDAKGREGTLVRRWDNYIEGITEPDCSNPTTTTNVRNRKGWPIKSTKVIETCEGVDAGTITTRRAFAAKTGFVHADMKVNDRGTPLRATGWWLPDPADPVAFGVTDEYGDVECTLRVVSCSGVELGYLEGGDRLSARRYRWRCPAASSD